MEISSMGHRQQEKSGKGSNHFFIKKKKKVLVIDAYSVHHPGDCSPQECEMPTFLS